MKLLVEFCEGAGAGPRYSAEIQPVSGASVQIFTKHQSSYLRISYNAGDSANDPSWRVSIDNSRFQITRIVGYLKL